MEVNISPFLSYHNLVHPAQLTMLIVDALKKSDQVLLVNKEPVSMQRNRFFELLDDICDFYQIDKTRITITTGNDYETHKEYKLQRQFSWYDNKPFSDFSISSLPWSREKMFGLFIGRLSSARMHAIQQCYSRGLSNVGLISHHQTINDDAVTDEDIVEFLREANISWDQVAASTRRSDIGDILIPPIVPPNSIKGWEKVYSQIPIEIVCETGEQDDVWSISEKIMRPIKYRRPFLLIAAPQTIRYLKETTLLDGAVDFRFFEDVMPINYDNFGGKRRVDMIFDILEELITTKKINDLLKQCSKDIDHNYRVLENIVAAVKISSATRFTREQNE